MKNVREYKGFKAHIEIAADDVAIYDACKTALAGGQTGRLPDAVSRLLLKGNSRLKAIRLWRDMTQTELAKLAGVGQGYISDMESGRRPLGGEVLQTLAARLNVPPEWIA